MRRALSLSPADQERIVRNEEQIKSSGVTVRIAELSNFPFKSMQEIWSAKANRQVEVFSPIYSGELISSLGSRSEVVINMLFTSFPLVGVILFLVAGLVSSKYLLLAGIPACLVGFFLFHPAAVLAIFLLPLFYFLRSNPVWLFVLGGFYAGVAFSLFARVYASMVIERIAISSEVFFCYLYCKGLISVKDTQTKQIYREKI